MSSTPPIRGSSFAVNIRWALGWTLFVATLYSVFAAILAATQRSTWFAPLGLSVWVVIFGYYIAAGFAALALAVLRPLGATKGGAYLLGVVVGFLVYASIGVIMEGVKGVVFVAAFIGSLFTGGLGVIAHDQGAPSWRGSGSLSIRKQVIYAVAFLIAVLLFWLDVRHGIITK